MALVSRMLAGALLTAAVAGCATGTAAPSGSTTPSPAPAPPAAERSVRVADIFAKGTGNARTYDPALVPAGARATVDGRSAGTGTTVTLTVAGLRPKARYGAHVHAKACGATGKDAGPHYQNQVDPVQPSVDPAYANPRNEIWLDLSTDDRGNGTATATVEWAYAADRRPGSVVIHAMGTSSEPGKAGTAGDRAACVSVAF